MRKITDYKIISITSVIEALDEGWQPWGSPYIDADKVDCQAMVKYEEPVASLKTKEQRVRELQNKIREVIAE